MKIALIDCPQTPLELNWHDVYFPDVPFPISDFLHDEPNELRNWHFESSQVDDVQAVIQEIQNFQPVVVGINDHQSTNALVLERLIKQMFPRALVFFSPTAIAPEQLMDKANQSAYRLRQRTRPVSGKIRFRSCWSLESFLHDIPPDNQGDIKAKITHLIEAYELAHWADQVPQFAFVRILETLEILEDAYPAEHPLWAQRNLRLLDVGSARWDYAPALYQFFSLAYTDTPRQVFLTGIELDAYRLDQEGYSCVDYALTYIDTIASFSRYLNQNILEHHPQQAYDVITHFNPYLISESHLFGGLPLEFYYPDKLLACLLSLRQPQGSLLITQNQSKDFVAQQVLFQEQALKPRLEGAFCSALSKQYEAFVSVLETEKGVAT